MLSEKTIKAVDRHYEIEERQQELEDDLSACENAEYVRVKDCDSNERTFFYASGALLKVIVAALKKEQKALIKEKNAL